MKERRLIHYTNLNAPTILGTGDVTTVEILNGTIINEDVKSDAAIAGTKVTAASVTVVGAVELATAAETNTGTDATRAVTPDAIEDWEGSAQVTTLGTISSGDVTAAVSASSTTVSGKVEASIASEVNTGTDAARSVTPDSLAGSNFGIKYMSFQLNGTVALTTSELMYFRIPAAFNGMNIVSVSAAVGTGAAGSSSSGTPTWVLTNVTGSGTILSTSLTIDAGEYTSASAAAAAVIDTAEDDVATDDLIKIDTTVSGAGVTYATVTIGCQLP